MNDSLTKRFSSKLFTNFFSLAISTVITLIVPRALGPIAYGNFMFLNDHFNKVIGFFGLGTSMSFFTKLSKRKDEIKLLRFYVFFLILILFASSLSLGAIYFSNFYEKIYTNITYQFVLLSFIYSFLLFLIGIFRQINDAYALTVPSEKYFLYYRILTLAILLLLYLFKFLSLLIYFVNLIFVSSILLIVWFLVLLKKKINPFERKHALSGITIKKYALEIYQYSHPLFFKGVVVLIVGISERWLLQYYGGSEQQGFYSFSFAVSSIIILFTTSIAPIFTTDFSIAWANQDFPQMRNLFNKLLPSLVFLTSFLSFFIASNGLELIVLLGGESYRGAGLSLSIMALYPIHQTYGQICGAVLYSSGKTKIIRNISIPFQVLGLVILYFLISSTEDGGLGLGAIGLTYKMIIFQLIIVNIFLWYCTKLLSLNFFKFLIFQILTILFFFSISFTLSFLFKNFSNFILLNLSIQGVIYLILVALVLYKFPKIINSSQSEIKNFMGSFLAKIF